MLENLPTRAPKLGAAGEGIRPAPCLWKPHSCCCDRTYVRSKQDEKFGTISLARHVPNFIALVLVPPPPVTVCGSAVMPSKFGDIRHNIQVMTGGSS